LRREVLQQCYLLVGESANMSTVNREYAKDLAILDEGYIYEGAKTADLN
jgi:hypothetical protein